MNEHTGQPGKKVMALVTVISIPAQIGRGLVVCRFVILIGASHVTTCTIAAMRHHSDMIPACRKKGIGPMTVITGVGRFYAYVVTCRSAGRLPAVMTGHALPGYCRSVIKARAQESRSIEMASFTRRIGHDVAGGFWRRYHALTQRMTTIASLGSTLEYAGDVTSLAGRRGMATNQRESGSSVIEVAPGKWCLCRRLH